MIISVLKDRSFYKHITSILKMSLEDAVKYIDSSSITHTRFIEYADNYLFYNVDFLTKEELRKREEFLNEVKDLHFKNMNKKERNRNIEKKSHKVDNDIYIKNRFLLEEYVDNGDYLFTILKKYKKTYNFFMDLLATAFISDNSYDQELYKKVSNLLVSKEYKVDQEIETIIPLVLGYIHEGIKIGNELVPFTPLDYYSIFNIPIEYFLLYQKEDIAKYKIIAFFRESYHDLRADYAFINPENIIPFNVERELKAEYTFNINGEYIKPSLEERQKVMGYLIENKFPIDLIIYKQALRRYASGLLELKPLKRTFE